MKYDQLDLSHQFRLADLSLGKSDACSWASATTHGIGVEKNVWRLNDSSDEVWGAVHLIQKKHKLNHLVGNSIINVLNNARAMDL